MNRRRALRGGWVLALVLVLGGCGASRQAPPEAGDSRGQVPNLQGRRVMVLPVQEVVGLSGAPDAELAFALQDRTGDRVRWVLPEEMRRSLRRSPGMPIRVDGLPVGIFLQAQVDRVGDPLFGHLRRLAAITSADLALIPIQVRHRPGEEETAPAVEIAAALIHARNGRVFWFGIVEGEPGGADDPRALASAADALARALIR